MTSIDTGDRSPSISIIAASPAVVRTFRPEMLRVRHSENGSGSASRALALEPELLVLDESTAALDVSVQARLLELLAHLQRRLHLTFLFIGHDLAVIQRVSHGVLVMRAGDAVEYRLAAELFAEPRDEYTRELLAAVPPARPRV